jgi:predicted transcriptional regulator
MLHTAVIDRALGTEAVAVYVFIMANRRTTTEEIAEHFGMSDLAVEFALQDLRTAGLLDEES